MTQAEHRLREMLAAEFPNLEVRQFDRESSTLEVSAAHKRVGPLRVQFEPDEITIFVGPAHCHFEHHEDEPEEAHIINALAFVREVLSDQMILWSFLGLAGGAYLQSRPRHFRLPWPIRRFVYSGPI